MAPAACLVATQLLLVSAATANGAPRDQAGVVLKRTVIARTQPRLSAHAVQRVWAYTPFRRTATVLPVIGRASDPDGGGWLHVRMPRPAEQRHGLDPGGAGAADQIAMANRG
jgi:hypothetical protein